MSVDSQKEQSLDPEDWTELTRLAHVMVDDMLGRLRTVRDRPAWQPLPDEVKAKFGESLPVDPQNHEDVYRDFCSYVRPYLRGNTHPGFWAWVEGSGTPFGALAEMLAAGLNPNVSFGEHAPVYVELQVLDWCKQIVGYPAGASGLLVSGGSEASVVGLAVARNAKANFDVAREGLRASPQRLTIYGSTETHSSIQKAVELLGLGSDSFRKVPVTRDFKIDIPSLRATIKGDRALGEMPFCVVGNAGTVNIGAIDDLGALAEVAGKEGLWFHIDGALGAVAHLAPGLKDLFKGMEQADSLAFDLHKWLSVPYEAGCILIRDAAQHHRVFATSAAYLAHVDRGVAGGPIWFAEYGIQLSRSFKALKVWMMLKHYGTKKYADIIQQNVDQARYLAALIEGTPELELLAPVTLNVVCFRFRAEGLSGPELDELNEEILMRLHEGGDVIPSSTKLHGKYAIRVAVTNHRSRRADFKRLVKEVLRQAQAIGRSRLRVP